ncbi:beta-ketoacyl-[acyl-carrier-protein] synthase family protein [bacterium]|nr:beta-ketoacyl-[acyl-carrier-protein] synthase family protein [bacterium]MBU1753922.1 beta-ketoacyl-[acyl-carrier-protein] synthase family protein [bacterium]
MSNRVVLTGIGIISPFGVGNDVFWKNLTQGKSGLRKITKFDTTHLKSMTAGEVLDFRIEDFVKNPRLYRIPRISQFTVVGANLAISDAKLNIKEEDSTKIGIFFGTCNGPSYSTDKIYQSLIEKGPSGVDPLLFQETVFNAPVSNLSILMGIKGPCIALPLGPASGSYALHFALNYLCSGRVNCAVVGASDEHTEMVHKAFEYLHVLSPDDRGEEKARPFDKNRNGGVLSEGSCFLILETLEHALQREASIYGEIIGDGMSSDAYKVADNEPKGLGVTLAMKQAIKKAGIEPSEIDYIVASAYGGRKIDKMETIAIKDVFREYAYQLPITSIKGAIGESMGPGGLFNLTTAFFAIREGIIPPTINWQEQDSNCDLDFVPNVFRNKEVNTAMANAFSWGGIYSSIIVRRCEI